MAPIAVAPHALKRSEKERQGSKEERENPVLGVLTVRDPDVLETDNGSTENEVQVGQCESKAAKLITIKVISGKIAYVEWRLPKPEIHELST